MSYKIKRNHEGLRMKNGVKGHYLFDVDGNRVMAERILTIYLTTDDLNSFCVVAILRSGKEIDLFSHSDFEFVEKKLENYRRRFEMMKRWK